MMVILLCDLTGIVARNGDAMRAQAAFSWGIDIIANLLA
jgi:hypothetical protein